ncbi:MAG: hypothetical protein KDA58_13710 [Planctomycetaceae bacterium]|nr:hypothetical protein [Planctomycetaceae bacterium]
MNIESKQQELAELKRRIEQLEAELSPGGRASASATADWPPKDLYTAYYLMVGGMLGIIGAIVSLMVNFVGAPAAGKSPAELVKVYLTFPFGERALDLSAENGSLILVFGICLYIATGMLIGIPIYYGMVRMCGKDAPLGKRMIWGSIFSLLVWVVAFYGVLSWLQPLLFNGNWVTDPAVLPPWVAAGTHLVFGWTLALLYPWGQFTPYQPASAQQPSGN